MLAPESPESSVCLVAEARKGSSPYLAEILYQQGFFVTHFTLAEFLEKIRDAPAGIPKVIVLAGATSLKSPQAKQLQSLVKSERVVLLLGPVAGLEDGAGAEMRVPNPYPFPVGGEGTGSLGEGYLIREGGDHQWGLKEDWWPLHGFGCVPLVNEDAVVLARYETPIATPEAEDGRWPAITWKTWERGAVMWFAPDLVKTLREIQEGRHVGQDGVPPADGSAPIDDNILKSEDGLVLDWWRDRRPLSRTQPVPAFMVPVSDAWRRIFTRCIEIAADHCGAELRRVDFWPGGAPFVAHISHDTDGNNERLARAMLADINALGIHTTWCLQPPGYSPRLCQEIRAAGHELAFHFDAQSFPVPGVFAEEVLREQLEETKGRTGICEFYSNKNHYTRWEGKTEFFRWCASAGIRVDQSKGPSKAGTLGFPFGSCHPWRAWDDQGGAFIDCLEISFQSQDLGLAGAPDIGPDLLAAVKHAQGVAHAIFHPAHHGEGIVTHLMHEYVATAQAMGGRFLTSREIGEWWHSRRRFLESNGAIPLPGASEMKRDPNLHVWVKLF